MSEKTTAINYIFYLQTKSEPDTHFYLLADVFSKININLLPISPDDLANLGHNKKNYIISMRNDLSSGMNFNLFKKSFLDTALISGQIVLYDISSFSEIEHAAKFQARNVYYYFPLPQNLKQIAMSVAVQFFRDKNTQAIWPGGRRSKLPTATEEP